MCIICILKEASDILNHFEFRRHTHYTQTEFRNFIPEGLHDSFNIGSFFYDAIALKQFQTTASYILLFDTLCLYRKNLSWSKPGSGNRGDQSNIIYH